MEEVISQHVSTVGAVAAAAHQGVMNCLCVASNRTPSLLLYSSITCPSATVAFWIFAQYVFNSKGHFLTLHHHHHATDRRRNSYSEYHRILTNCGFRLQLLFSFFSVHNNTASDPYSEFRRQKKE